MKKFQIFVSSTYLDLIDERQAAVEAILKAGHIPAGMELFTASNQSQWSIVQKWIDESDVYMLILGGRYGSIEPISGLSYTELEYNYALEKKKPLFAVVMKDSALEEKVKTCGRSVLESEHPQKLKDFKKKVLMYMSSFFEDSKDIKLAFHESIIGIQQENELTGWVRGDKILNPQQYLDRITALQYEKEVINQENIKLKETIEISSSSLNDFEEIIKIYSNEIINLEKLHESEPSFPKEATLLNILCSFKTDLIVGVTNGINSSAINTFLFFNVAPRLQINGLMQLEKISSDSIVRRFIISEKGQDLLAYMAKKQLRKNK